MIKSKCYCRVIFVTFFKKKHEPARVLPFKMEEVAGESWSWDDDNEHVRLVYSQLISTSYVVFSSQSKSVVHINISRDKPAKWAQRPRMAFSFVKVLSKITSARPLLKLMGENLIRPTGIATIMTQCHILVIGMTLGSRFSCLIMVEVLLFPLEAIGRAVGPLP
jgi:hypothetical protein